MTVTALPQIRELPSRALHRADRDFERLFKRMNLIQAQTEDAGDVHTLVNDSGVPYLQGNLVGWSGGVQALAVASTKVSPSMVTTDDVGVLAEFVPMGAGLMEVLVADAASVTPGNVAYVSNTAGYSTPTAPANRQIIGRYASRTDVTTSRALVMLSFTHVWETG